MLDEPGRTQTILHLTYLPIDQLVEYLWPTKRRIQFVGPGLPHAAAEVIAERWMQLGREAVEVVVDDQPEVCRLGFGDGESLRTLANTASQMNGNIYHQPGVRLWAMGVDGRVAIFLPAPRLIEDCEDEGAGVQENTGYRICLHDHTMRIPAPAHRALTLEEIHRPEDNLRLNPPKPSDLERRVRILSAHFQFVEFSLQNAALSRKRVPVPPDLP